ncbi:hypothetical protein BT69DRAFT_1322204 [Atractiella rhizophila]|nr:hypothetical protein BT69DRAFT_1322204 [Atractiella rhizophila]
MPSLPVASALLRLTALQVSADHLFKLVTSGTHSEYPAAVLRSYLARYKTPIEDLLSVPAQILLSSVKCELSYQPSFKPRSLLGASNKPAPAHPLPSRRSSHTSYHTKPVPLAIHPHFPFATVDGMNDQLCVPPLLSSQLRSSLFHRRLRSGTGSGWGQEYTSHPQVALAMIW